MRFLTRRSGADWVLPRWSSTTTSRCLVQTRSKAACRAVGIVLSSCEKRGSAAKFKNLAYMCTAPASCVSFDAKMAVLSQIILLLGLCLCSKSLQAHYDYDLLMPGYPLHDFGNPRSLDEVRLGVVLAVTLASWLLCRCCRFEHSC